jgi:eukaryotic-like serine/threonine-protein kinase
VTVHQWHHVKELFDAALQQAPEARETFIRDACAGDEVLLAELESLLAEDDVARMFLEPATTPGWARHHDGREPEARGTTDRVGAYRLLRQIGRGGMADVYLAARSDHFYRRFVAVKVVRSAGLRESADVLSRFRHERQALAILDHPNIVKLLDGGTTEHGVPYLVMDYVRGTPIDEYCERHRCSIPERLHLFCTICAAVHYAHQNLIIHRDLKPSNIVVTPEGVPKLLDFGIAKLLQPELWSHTIGLTGSEMRLMTPAYASPEQLRGEPITTASDVYSLGVLLYELLTGHSPYPAKHQTPLELERAICDLAPEKPSTAIDRIDERRSTSRDATVITLSPELVSASREGTSDKLRRRLKGELDTIVLMALRKEPQRRYASVEQFANDIQRHLKGVPVIACKDTFRYRSGKFIRRHTVALATTAAIIVLLAAAATIAWSQSRAAQAQHARAERRFNEVRQLAHFMLFEFDEALRSGATRARTVVISKALHYLDRLSGDAADDLSLQRELIEGYLKVGDLQGNLHGPNLGDQRGARASYERALRLAEAVRRTDAANPASGRDVARANQKLAELLSVGGDVTDAVKRLSIALEIFDAVARERPSDAQSQRDLMSAVERLGSTQYLRGDLGAALQSYERYSAIARRLSAAEPASVPASRALARADEEMGKILALSGRRDEAIYRLRRALEIYESLAAIDPSNASLRRAVSVTYTNLGDVLAGAGRTTEALTHYRQSVRALERLAREDPENRQSRRDLALTLAFLASASKSQDESEARQCSARALGLLRTLADDPDASAVNHREYAWLIVTTPFKDLRDVPTARRHAETATRMTNGTDPGTLDTLANAYFLSGEVTQAAEIERRALALLPSSPHGEGSHMRAELEANLERFVSALPVGAASVRAATQQPRAK